MEKSENLKWFATRVIRDRSYVNSYLSIRGVETSGIEDIKSLLFIRCTEQEIIFLKSELYDRVLFYRDAERRVEPIPEDVMKTFLILAPFHDSPVFYLPVDDPEFFSGKRKRVVKGVFAGCEGVVRRIKGERRLIVRLSERAAIATPYIPQEFLEDINT